MALTADDLLPTIKKLAISYLDEIGGESNANSFIFIYLTQALRRLAHIAYQQYDADSLTISGDGYVTFNRGSLPITDLYAPLRILDISGKEVKKRTSFADTSGWWRESSNTRIHVKGMNGNYVLQYIAYPPTVNQTTSPIGFPDAASIGLCYFTAALIVESLPNGKDLAAHYYGLADRHMKVGVQANIDGRGHSSGGFVPSLNTVDTAFGG